MKRKNVNSFEHDISSCKKYKDKDKVFKKNPEVRQEFYNNCIE